MGNEQWCYVSWRNNFQKFFAQRNFCPKVVPPSCDKSADMLIFGGSFSFQRYGKIRYNKVDCGRILAKFLEKWAQIRSTFKDFMLNKGGQIFGKWNRDVIMWVELWPRSR
jgi:hypothetical protein